MAETVEIVHPHTQVNLTNRVNNNKGCAVSSPYKTYKTNDIPVMEKFITRKTRLVTNRIRDGDIFMPLGVGRAYHATRKEKCNKKLKNKKCRNINEKWARN